MSDRDTNANAFISRRQFCVGACQVASSITVASLVSACGSGSSSPSSPGGAATILAVVSGQFTGAAVQVTTAGSPLTDVGGAALVQSIAGSFLISRTSASAFSAIDAVCTHEGCTINGADGAVYVCPCHGSRYSLSGQVLGGPATASLRQYANSFANGILTISI